MIRIILALMLLLISLFTQAQTEIISVEAELSMGRHSVDCTGRGACSFTVGSTSPRLNKSEVKVMSKKTTLSTFVVTIPISELSKEDEIKIAGKLFSDIKINDEIAFIQEESLLLDNTTLRNLGIQEVYNKIDSGTYSMKIHKESVEITFTLTKSE